MATKNEERYIIWDPRDGEPRHYEDGTIMSDGLVGRVGRNNAYIRIYAAFNDDVVRDINDDIVLEVGEFAVARFSLSGSKGTYRVYRVS